MKKVLSLVVLAAVGLAGMSRAGEHDEVAPVSVNAGLLGQFEGLRDFCVKADPGAAQTYVVATRSFTQSIDRRSLDRARDSSAYRQGFQTIVSMLDTVPRADRKKTCASLFAPSAS